MELGLNKIRFTLLPLHQQSKKDGAYRPFCFARRQHKVTNLARKPTINA